ncbi:MAG TPA: DUF3098 domain-containing protein [Candidatus Kapabacteria bacterium]|nr:DUF3098 domain-containing protein [Candidatus Kapabacteria bacterium]
MAKQSPTPSARRTSPTPSRTVARKPTTTTARRAKEQSKVHFEFPWTHKNVIGVVVGLAVIAAGYLLMGTAVSSDVANNDGIWNRPEAVTIAPILLAIGYCVIIPYFIFKRFDSSDVAEGEQQGSAQPSL